MGAEEPREETGEKAEKTRERHNCCVPGCSAVKNADNHMHNVPKDDHMRKKWQIAIKSGKNLSSTMKVCSRHFVQSDYKISCKYL